MCKVRIPILFLTIVLFFGSIPVLAEEVLPFSDVSENNWYYTSVAFAYADGLMIGTSENSFSPDNSVTVAQAIALAARIHNSYNGNSAFVEGNPWYQVYIDYADENGITQKIVFDSYTRPITRAEVAAIFAHSLPAEALSEINTVSRIPDVSAASSYADEIFTLYRAGVLTGNDSIGTFSPDSLFTRAQCATIAVRMVRSEQRKAFSLNIAGSLTSAERAKLQKFLSHFDPTIIASITKNSSPDKLIWWAILDLSAYTADSIEYDFTAPSNFPNSFVPPFRVAESKVEEHIEKTFGVHVTPQNVSDRAWYFDGYYYSGLGNGLMTVAYVSELYDNGDGSFNARMNFYEDYDAEKHYSLPFEEASKDFVDAGLWDGSGYLATANAKIKLVNYNGSEIYQMDWIYSNYPNLWD